MAFLVKFWYNYKIFLYKYTMTEVRESLADRQIQIDDALKRLEINTGTDLISAEEMSDRYLLAYATTSLASRLNEVLDIEDFSLDLDEDVIIGLEYRVEELSGYLEQLARDMNVVRTNGEFDLSLNYQIGDNVSINLHDIELQIGYFNRILTQVRKSKAALAATEENLEEETEEELIEDGQAAGLEQDDIRRLRSVDSESSARSLVSQVAEDAEERPAILQAIIDFFRNWFSSGFIGGFLGRMFNFDDNEETGTAVRRSPSISPMELGGVVYEGPVSADNFMNTPSLNQVSDYQPSSSNTPDRWYSTPEGLRWFDGKVLLKQSHRDYLIRSGYRPNQGRTIEEFIEQELIVETTFFNGIFRCNRELAWRLQNAQFDLEAEGINYNIDNNHTGAFSYRGIARQDYPYISNHAFGLAVDFNHNHNDWESGIIPDYEQQFGPRFEQIMAQNGLRIPRTWGRTHDHDHGDSRDIDADWMHFDIIINEDGTYMDTHSASLAYGN